MSRRALLDLPPTDADRRVSEWFAEEECPPLEEAMKGVTLAADGRVMMTLAVLAWLGARAYGVRARRGTDHLLLTAAAATALPHGIKRIVRRERPDRRGLRWLWRSVPRSGNAYDSFPSGHAVHLGAAAAALSRLLPPAWRAPIWGAALGIGASRVALLAHWLTDVAAGFAIGLGLEAAIAKARDPRA